MAQSPPELVNRCTRDCNGPMAQTHMRHAEKGKGRRNAEDKDADEDHGADVSGMQMEVLRGFLCASYVFDSNGAPSSGRIFDNSENI